MNSTSTPSRFRFERVGTMSYRVTRRETGEHVGHMWRTREGWMLAPLGAPRREAFGISRETAAGAMAATATAAVERAQLAAEHVEIANPFRASFPAAAPESAPWTDRVVTEGHAAACREFGHASWKVDGVDVGRCPRCGEVTEAAAQPAAEPVAGPVTVVGHKPTFAGEARTAFTARTAARAFELANDHGYTVRQYVLDVAGLDAYTRGTWVEPVGTTPAEQVGAALAEFDAESERIADAFEWNVAAIAAAAASVTGGVHPGAIRAAAEHAAAAAIAASEQPEPRRFAIRHTFPNGGTVGNGYVNSGTYSDTIATYSREDAEAAAANMRTVNPGHTFEVVRYPEPVDVDAISLTD